MSNLRSQLVEARSQVEAAGPRENSLRAEAHRAAEQRNTEAAARRVAEEALAL